MVSGRMLLTQIIQPQLEVIHLGWQESLKLNSGQAAQPQHNSYNNSTEICGVGFVEACPNDIQYLFLQHYATFNNMVAEKGQPTWPLELAKQPWPPLSRLANYALYVQLCLNKYTYTLHAVLGTIGLVIHFYRKTCSLGNNRIGNTLRKYNYQHCE